MIRVVTGDITLQITDAIVNAANTHLIAGSGVCGAIHRVAGPKLEIECLKIGQCPTGESRITDSYDLPCNYVIHTVGPRYLDGTRGEAETLYSCYQSIFYLTKENNIDSISIPAISTGIYGFPVREATEIAFAASLAAQKERDLLVQFICFDDNTAQIYKNIYRRTHQ
jgi:O-acetyl-ADP-ribose deacetylase (regulator of RNase III)